jgi:hypothetical protein
MIFFQILILFFSHTKVKVTEVRLKKPFIKIITQNINTAKYQNLISSIQVFFTNSYADKDKGNITLDAMCIAKIGKEIYRCRVIGFEHDGSVRINFIDNGFTGKIPITELKLLPKDHQLCREPPICKEFILGGLVIETHTKDYRERLKKMYHRFFNNLFEMVIVGKVNFAFFSCFYFN